MIQEKTKGKESEGKFRNLLKPPLFLKVKEFLLSFLCARFSYFSFIRKQNKNDKQI